MELKDKVREVGLGRLEWPWNQDAGFRLPLGATRTGVRGSRT